MNTVPLNNIDTNDFVLKPKYQTDKSELENKIPNVTDSVKKAKLTELEKKIPDISNLATKSALTAVENKISSVSNLVKIDFMVVMVHILLRTNIKKIVILIVKILFMNVKILILIVKILFLIMKMLTIIVILMLIEYYYLNKVTTNILLDRNIK